VGDVGGGVESAVKVVMVIMTFYSAPTCFTHRLSTGEIIFWVVDLVLELVGKTPVLS